jgi:hypothetical protein
VNPTGKQLVTAIDGVLKPDYSRKGSTWRRDYGEIIAVVNLQKSGFGDDFYLNLGVYLKDVGDASTPTEAQCHIRWRPLVAAGGALPSDPASVVTLLREIGLPQIAQLRTRAAIARFLNSSDARDFLIHRDARTWANAGTGDGSA